MLKERNEMVRNKTSEEDISARLTEAHRDFSMEFPSVFSIICK